MIEREILQKYLAAGMSLPEIGRIIGRPVGTVGYWVTRHGLVANGSHKFRPGKGLKREALAPLVAEGLTLGQIASRLEVGTKTVCYWIAKYELPKPKEVRAGDTAERLRCGDTRAIRRCRHHGDVEFVMDGKGHTVGIRLAREEAAKCALLCANCHVEVELGITRLPPD